MLLLETAFRALHLPPHLAHSSRGWLCCAKRQSAAAWAGLARTSFKPAFQLRHAFLEVSNLLLCSVEFPE